MTRSRVANTLSRTGRHLVAARSPFCAAIGISFLIALGVDLAATDDRFAPGAREDKDSGARDADRAGTNPVIRLVPSVDRGKFFGDLVVQGKPLRVILDTGSAFPLVLVEGAARRLGLKLEPRAKNLWSTSVQLGVHGTDRELPARALVVPAPPASFEGAIGWPILRQIRWRLDLGGGTQAVTPRIPPDVQAEWPSFAIRPKVSVLLLEGATERGPNHEPKSVCFDTGADSGVGLDGPAWMAWREQNPDAWMTVGGVYSPAAGGFTAAPVAIAPTFRLGAVDLAPCLVGRSVAEQDVLGRPLKLNMNLGLSTFSGRTIWIDGPGLRVYVGPAGRERSFLMPLNPIQATFIPKNLAGTFSFAHVVPDGFAAHAGLRSGDKLLRVNGLDATRWRQDERVRPSRFLAGEPGTSVRLVVERDGEKLEFELVLPKLPALIEGRDEAPDTPPQETEGRDEARATPSQESDARE